jgi:hypothetical protein
MIHYEFECSIADGGLLCLWRKKKGVSVFLLVAFAITQSKDSSFVGRTSERQCFSRQILNRKSDGTMLNRIVADVCDAKEA